MEVIDKLGDEGMVSKHIIWKFVVKVNDIKVGVVVEEDKYDEEVKYYKFIDDKFSEEELEDDVLSEDEKYEIFEIWREEING